MRLPNPPVLLALLCVWLAAPASADPLPSWNDTAAKARIAAFVERVTDPASPDYVTPAARIAVFDNDGTLWSEKPVYFQLLFALDRLREMAASDPSILSSAVLRAGAAGDMEAVAAAGEEGLLELVLATHSGLTVEAFEAAVSGWLDTATHPTADRPFDRMVFQPMLELLVFLRDEGFTTYIVSARTMIFIKPHIIKN